MRELRLRAKVLAKETKARVEWALKTGRWTVVIHGVLGRGPEPPSTLDIGRATALATEGICHGRLAGELHNFDNVRCRAPEVWVSRKVSNARPGVTRRTTLPKAGVRIHQVLCTTPADTLLELATVLDDDEWEQAMESAGRRGLVTREQLQGWAQTDPRVRRVIDARGGLDIPFTDSLLETRAVQLLRRAGLPTPIRQFEVIDPRSGRVVARCDLAWPELGIFVELDGQHHKDQPVYDARRQTLITTITKWGCGRLTWEDVVVKPEWGEAQLRDLLSCLVP